jgi:PhnB protein
MRRRRNSDLRRRRVVPANCAVSGDSEDWFIAAGLLRSREKKRFMIDPDRGATPMTKIPRPEGHHTITPAFAVTQAADVIAFIQGAFGGTVVDRYDGPGGSVAHAEVRIGDSVVMLGEPMGDMQPMPAMLSYYVEDGPAVDAAYKRALDFGAISVAEPQDQFYGYRSATVADNGGNRWTICAVIEQLSREEIERRMAKMQG